jgi:hypothetical protein
MFLGLTSKETLPTHHVSYHICQVGASAFLDVTLPNAADKHEWALVTL